MKLNRFAKDLLAGRWVEILRAGTWNRTEFTVDDLRDMATSYDPEYRSAPLLIGHPSPLGVEGERPAHGMITKLRVVGESLQARIEGLTDVVIDGLTNGHWINRSVELLKFKDAPGKSWYLTGLALLGGSQPAVSAMLSAQNADALTLCESIEDTKSNSDTEIGQPSNHEGAANMADQDVGKLQEKLAALEAQLVELSKRPNISVDEFAKLSAKVVDLDKITAENQNLQAQVESLRSEQADALIMTACQGIPKALASDEKKALMKQLYLSGDTRSFSALVAELEATRAKFSYLTEELVGEGEQNSTTGYEADPKADDRSAKIAAKAHELRTADKNLSVEASIKQAVKEIG